MSTFNSKFPVYSLAYHVPSCTLILGGGGGPSRSGVPNGILVLRVSGNRSKSCHLEEIGELKTGDEAVMSLSLYDDKMDCLLVAGVNDRCWLLEFENYTTTTDNKNTTNSNSNSNSNSNNYSESSISSGNRVSSIVKALNNSQSPKITTAPLNLLRTIQSDSSPNDDGYLRVTRFTPTGRSFIAAGSDGSVREWAVPEMRLLSKIGIDSEILDTDKNDKFLALVSSSGQIHLKSTISTSSDLITLKPSDNFVYKLVRFHKNFLYVLENFKPTPGSKKSKKNPKLVIFNLDEFDRKKGRDTPFKPIKSQSLPISKNCTCFHPSPDSDHFAFGFADGSLLLLSLADASLSYLNKKEAHPFPITGLAVDPVKNILITSSADGQVQITQIPSKLVNTSPTSTTLYTIILSVLFLIISVLVGMYLRNFDFKLNEIDDFDSFYKLFPTELEL